MLDGGGAPPPALEGLLGPQRALILRRLVRPASVGTLAEALMAVPSAPCHHIAFLERAGLATRERQGRRVLVRTPAAASCWRSTTTMPGGARFHDLENAVSGARTGLRSGATGRRGPGQRMATVKEVGLAAIATRMNGVRSRDGTAFDRTGQGPPVVLVGGAFSYRAFPQLRELAKLLASDFTVVNYDRRGRGESGDMPPSLSSARSRTSRP